MRMVNDPDYCSAILNILKIYILMSNSKCTNYNGGDAGQGTHKVHINPYYPKLFKTFPIKKRQARRGVEGGAVLQLVMP